MPNAFQRNSRSETERELLEKTERFLPAGTRNPAFSPEYAMIIREGRGSKIIDCSDNEYIDYLLVNEPAVQLAEKIVRAVPCAEKVCFHNSGSEATFFAMRLARAFRKRDKILKFEGGISRTGRLRAHEQPVDARTNGFFQARCQLPRHSQGDRRRSAHHPL